MRDFRNIWIGVAIFAYAIPNLADDCASVEASLARGKRLYQGGQSLLGSVHFSLVQTSGCPGLIQEAKWYFALSMQALGESAQALSTMNELETGGPHQHSARLLRAYAYGGDVEGLSANDRGRLSLWNARNDSPLFFEKLQISSIPVQERLQLKDLQMRIENSPSRNPWIAGVSSVLLPGAGQAYVGAWQSAAVAFAFNAIFLGTTLEFAKHDLHFAAAASGLVFSVTYIGNIVSAVSAARSHNENASSAQQRALRMTLFPELDF